MLAVVTFLLVFGLAVGLDRLSRDDDDGEGECDRRNAWCWGLEVADADDDEYVEIRDVDMTDCWEGAEVACWWDTVECRDWYSRYCTNNVNSRSLILQQLLRCFIPSHKQVFTFLQNSCIINSSILPFI